MANEFQRGVHQYVPVFNELGIELYSSAGTPTASGPAAGALVVDTTNSKLYINTGTAGSATWNAVGDVDASEITLNEGNVLVGDASNVGTAVDASTSGQILVGDGTTVASVAMSGDATLASGGALTIANNAVETAMINDNAVTNSKVADSAGTSALTLTKSAIVVYDFSVDGGTAGTVTLTGSPTIPDNAVVWVDSYEVVTTCTSSTDAATIALSTPTDGALTTAIAISDGSNPWDQGVFVKEQGGLATALPKKLTAARVPELTIAGGENVTAGKIIFHLTYWVSE